MNCIFGFPQASSRLTPLVCAVMHREDDLVELLLGAGASVNSLDEQQCALAKAIYPLSSCNILIVKSLLQHGANPNINVVYETNLLHALLQTEDVYRDVDNAGLYRTIGNCLNLIIAHGSVIEEQDIRRFPTLSTRVDRYIHETIVDCAVAFDAFDLPTYPLFFVLAFMPQFSQHWTRHKTVSLVERVIASVRRVNDENDEKNKKKKMTDEERRK